MATVTRIKVNSDYKEIEALEIEDHIHSGVLQDDIIEVLVKEKDNDITLRLRKVRFYGRENKREFEFLTNLFDLRPDFIAALYKGRWQIETLFK